MKIWKILEGTKIVAYVQVSKDCQIYNDSYAALQLVRKELNNPGISGTQKLDVDSGEQMQEGIPVFVLE